MRVLITGSNGFIGKNLVVHLNELKDIEVETFSRENTISQLMEMCSKVDFIIHLAGINRPKNNSEFTEGNENLTTVLCDVLSQSGRKVPIILASSIQAVQENLYGKSKLASEEAVEEYSRITGSEVYIYRLPNVFGKWCKPNYNSVVATFCYNIVNNLEININDPDVELSLVYIDDVVEEFVSVLSLDKAANTVKVNPVYNVTLSDLAKTICAFRDDNKELKVGTVGQGLTRCLYSTYLSYKTPKMFSYKLVAHEDSRGTFVEMLKTENSGQFSFFTAHPGITRGGHYHHSKTEKFLVIKGSAKFKFRNIVTDELYEINTTGKKAEIVETIPGWVHDITNVGDDEMFVMLWANEIFDNEHPDTYASVL